MTRFSDEELIEAYLQNQHGSASWTFKKTMDLMPWRVMAACFLLYTFVQLYYWEHCVYDSSERQWVSKPMNAPISTDFSLWEALMPFLPLQEEAKPYWTEP
mmetsp:Transcript_126197/g.235906  ORF Transcript_126197/g.235906 Transcript_126197/m.235906 type:complete len:101 (+) Transcript_126197:1-303(+)